MSHYAKVNNGIVETVIVADQDFVDNYIDGLPGEWIQTSYNTCGGKHYDQEGNEDGGTPLRKNFACKGSLYTKELDAFHEAQPFNSWTFNETTCLWEPPVAMPEDNKFYKWDEATTNWVEIT